MSSKDYTTRFDSPLVKEFCALRSQVGWGDTNLEMAQKSLNNSLFHVGVMHCNQLVAMGRIVGDGAMYFYVQDVVVHPEYQGQGLGSIVMEHLEKYLSQAAYKGSTVALLSAKGKEVFYERFGYTQRPSDHFGNGMSKFL
ncbi:Acetyltransferase (GNAT) domain [Shewanella psychrophila]|uniref:Acetyltransferase (GNAT) domain n=1 Tax=Shewanella psychrophila TaxID=225848 RepID=A0A1S6HSX2_9GAMM|nr:GNAT family N-acetyltransferase [Shewanella psychrophila]AQS38623.1 Acetyltransferase (GNAT) domain [Shewanella psychrophila]